jgi:hypothetical protein
MSSGAEKPQGHRSAQRSTEIGRRKLKLFDRRSVGIALQRLTTAGV